MLTSRFVQGFVQESTRRLEGDLFNAEPAFLRNRPIPGKELSGNLYHRTCYNG
jgi:hypothetical protein